MSRDNNAAVPLRTPTAIPVSTAGILPTDAVAVIPDHLAPILGPWATSSRVRLTRLPEPGLLRPLVAQVNVQLTAGRQARAQVAAATMSEVVGLLAARLIGQLDLFPDALAECLRQRAGTLPPPTPPELLPPSVRRVVRRKAGQPATMPVTAAIVIRAGAGGYRILQARPNPIGLEITAPPIALAALRRSSLVQAKARLDLTGASFDVYVDHQTGRLQALYARYDGHYGLLASTVAARSAHGTS
jgi:hypothetical protein